MIKETKITLENIEKRKQRLFKRLSALHYHKDRLMYRFVIEINPGKKLRHLQEMINVEDRIKSIYPHFDNLILIKNEYLKNKCKNN